MTIAVDLGRKATKPTKSAEMSHDKTKSMFRERNVFWGHYDRTCYPSVYTMDHPDLTVSNFIRNPIGTEGVTWYVDIRLRLKAILFYTIYSANCPKTTCTALWTLRALIHFIASPIPTPKTYM